MKKYSNLQTNATVDDGLVVNIICPITRWNSFEKYCRQQQYAIFNLKEKLAGIKLISQQLTISEYIQQEVRVYNPPLLKTIINFLSVDFQEKMHSLSEFKTILIKMILASINEKHILLIFPEDYHDFHYLIYEWKDFLSSLKTNNHFQAKMYLLGNAFYLGEMADEECGEWSLRGKESFYQVYSETKRFSTNCY